MALNPDSSESKLFGHAAGSFTGALADRAGLFKKAEGEKVLLDEIGDVPEPQTAGVAQQSNPETSFQAELIWLGENAQEQETNLHDAKLR